VSILPISIQIVTVTERGTASVKISTFGKPKLKPDHPPKNVAGPPVSTMDESKRSSRVRKTSCRVLFHEGFAYKCGTLYGADIEREKPQSKRARSVADKGGLPDGDARQEFGANDSKEEIALVSAPPTAVGNTGDTANNASAIKTESLRNYSCPCCSFTSFVADHVNRHFDREHGSSYSCGDDLLTDIPSVELLKFARSAISFEIRSKLSDSTAADRVISFSLPLQREVFLYAVRGVGKLRYYSKSDAFVCTLQDLSQLSAVLGESCSWSIAFASLATISIAPPIVLSSRFRRARNGAGSFPYICAKCNTCYTPPPLHMALGLSAETLDTALAEITQQVQGQTSDTSVESIIGASGSGSVIEPVGSACALVSFAAPSVAASLSSHGMDGSQNHTVPSLWPNPANETIASQLAGGHALSAAPLSSRQRAVLRARAELEAALHQTLSSTAAETRL